MSGGVSIWLLGKMVYTDMLNIIAGLEIAPSKTRLAAGWPILAQAVYGARLNEDLPSVGEIYFSTNAMPGEVTVLGEHVDKSPPRSLASSSLNIILPLYRSHLCVHCSSTAAVAGAHGQDAQHQLKSQVDRYNDPAHGVSPADTRRS